MPSLILRARNKVSWKAIKEWIPDDDPDFNWFNQERNPTSAEVEIV